MAKKKNARESWSLRESILTFIPGNSVYGTMRSRQARHGVLFILPFIIGFLVFMAKPLIESFIMSFNDVSLVAGGGYSSRFVALENYKYAFGVAFDAFLGELSHEQDGRAVVGSPRSEPSYHVGREIRVGCDARARGVVAANVAQKLVVVDHHKTQTDLCVGDEVVQLLHHPRERAVHEVEQYGPLVGQLLVVGAADYDLRLAPMGRV